MTRAKAIQIFALPLAVIYVIGVIFSHFMFSADDRAACHQAGGFMGRIWCPDSVDTAGFTVHFVKALGWPVEVFQPDEQSGELGNAVAAARLNGETAGKLRPLAQQGDAKAQFKLGLLYEDGRGVATNYEESAKWFRLAAEQGEPEAQNSLSFAYAKGKGVGQNFVEAYKWASLATAQGAEKTIVERATLIANMSEAQIAEAERLARTWQPKSAEVASLQLREETERVAITDVQRMLGILGYRLGDAEGVLGPRTQSAIADFQSRAGMQTSSTISRELIARLRNSVQAKQTKAGENK